MGGYRDPLEQIIVREEMLSLEAALEGQYRCRITGNMCGTDTRPANRPCLCEPCEAHAEALERLIAERLKGR